MLRRFKIKPFERGLRFVDGVFVDILGEGTHWFFDPLHEIRVDVLNVRDPWIRHRDLDVIVRSGALNGEASVVDLHDDERALVWIDGRLDDVLVPGLYALWTVFRQVVVEVIDASHTRFNHPEVRNLLGRTGLESKLRRAQVDAGHIGLFYEDGRYRTTLAPGLYGFWMNGARVEVRMVDLREITLDVNGQEIMTADKVTLRINAVVTFKVVDPVKAVSDNEDYRQALYREAQLVLRAVVGIRDLDTLLSEKDAVAHELEQLLVGRAELLGLQVLALGIRDVILPGEMRDLMNRVIEAKKAAEAALITRREETAAMRSQANTAKLLEQNPTLMRLRELEVLEKVAEKANLTVMLGEQGLTDRVVKLL